jgi:hypothetical protein
MTNRVDEAKTSQPTPTPGPFLAKVVSHLDPTYMGGLEVEILRPVGNNASEGQVHQVKYMSPFYGVTGVAYTAEDPDDFNNTQKSYGMWMIPPDPGTQVVVIFIDGDPKRGYWIGCVQDENMNFMIPGLAATQFAVGGKGERSPVAEYNKKINRTAGDTTQYKKPKHPFATVLEKQGLNLDDVRGTTTSSARRETPSSVFGISTPGPLDKNSGSKRGAIGKAEHAVVNAPVSRLGGATFVMDDGDDKFLRKKPASEAGPDYASVEQGETGGNVNIPHNELVRIRTRTGHQILLHNSEDLIYIGNARGTAWVELTSNGKIDVYSADSISVYTGNDLNISAARDINFNAGGNINMKSTGYTKITPTENFEVLAKNTNIDGGNIHLNSGKATKAFVPVRVPTAEPWVGHENLAPDTVVPAKTRAVETPPKITPPKPYKQPTTKTDTFAKIKGSEGKK